MAAVKGRGNASTELAFLKALRRKRVSGWRRHASALPGRPDFAFRRQRLAVFLDGCFWHGCPRCYRRPASHRAYWDQKLRRNMRRDRLRLAALRRLGWRIMRLWEHQIRSNPDRCVTLIQKRLKSTEA